MTDGLFEKLRFERRGAHDLVPVVAQDRVTGEIRMLAWATPDAVRRTLETGRATFFSRSRGELWEKGQTSGNVLEVAAVLVDCDADALVYLVTPRGPTCHTGAPSCFFRRVSPSGTLEESAPASTLLARLDAVLVARREASAEKSYVKALYDGGADKIGEKLREEADELARAVGAESDERVVAEAADLLFHLMVALRARDVGIADVLQELEGRFGLGGHVEKEQRGGDGDPSAASSSPDERAR